MKTLVVDVRGLGDQTNYAASELDTSYMSDEHKELVEGLLQFLCDIEMELVENDEVRLVSEQSTSGDYELVGRLNDDEDEAAVFIGESLLLRRDEDTGNPALYRRRGDAIVREDECHNCGAELPEIDENGEARCPECKALHTLMNESEA